MLTPSSSFPSHKFTPGFFSTGGNLNLSAATMFRVDTVEVVAAFTISAEALMARSLLFVFEEPNAFSDSFANTVDSRSTLKRTFSFNFLGSQPMYGQIRARSNPYA
jgi:hypothetical protein